MNLQRTTIQCRSRTQIEEVAQYKKAKAGQNPGELIKDHSLKCLFTVM